MRKRLPLLLHLTTLAVVVTIIVTPAPNWLAVVPMAVWYILWGPLAVYGLPTLSLSLADLEVIPDGVPTTPESDEWARRVAAEFASHGFIPRARFRTRAGQNIDFAQRFDNPTTGEVATIMAGRRPTVGGVVPLRLVVFHTRFADGDLGTSNAYAASITPRLPGQRIFRLPRLDSPSLIYGLHRLLVKQDGRAPVPMTLGDDPLAWEREQHERALATHVAHGLAVPDEHVGRLRQTWKGAFRNTWLLHPFLTRMHDRRAIKQAEAALRLTVGATPA